MARNEESFSTGRLKAAEQYMLIPDTITVTDVKISNQPGDGKFVLQTTDLSNLKKVVYNGKNYQVLHFKATEDMQIGAETADIRINLFFNENVSNTEYVYRFFKSDVHKNLSTDIKGNYAVEIADSLDLDEDGDTSEKFFTDTTANTIKFRFFQNLSTKGTKTIEKDSGNFGWYALKKPKDAFKYKINIENDSVGSAETKLIRMIDVLPFVGDTRISDTASRNTEFDGVTIDSITLENGAPLPAGVNVYSTTTVDYPNAKNELTDLTKTFISWQTGLVPNAKMIKVEYTNPLKPKEKLVLELNGKVPTGVPNDKKAWNSFAYASIYDNGANPNIITAIAEPYNAALLVSNVPPMTISGEVFEDTNKNALKDEAPLKTFANVEVRLYDSLNNLLEIQNTDANGKYLFGDLYQDNYTVRVYNPDKTKYVVAAKNVGSNLAIDNDFAVDPTSDIVKADAQLTTTSLVNVDAAFYDPTAKLRITKKDASGKLLAGASFGIYSGATLIEEITTDATGIATMSVILQPGNYSYKETVRPNGYLLDTTSYPFTITGLEPNGLYEVININAKDIGIIEILKTDSVTGAALSGAVFEVKDSASLVVDTITTDALGKAKTKDLDPGTYTVAETKAPLGYQLDTRAKTATLVDGAIVAISLTFTDVKDIGIAEITKTDSVTGAVLAGAIFEVKDSTGLLVDTITTDANGHAATKDLDPGAYTLTETKAPIGYQLDGTAISFSIVEGASVPIQIAVKNVKDIGAVELEKVDKITNAKLQGAEFEIKDANGLAIETITTNILGLAKSTKDLDPGAYTLTETKAPIGYILDATPISFTIVDGASTAVKVTAKNDRDVRQVIVTKKSDDGSLLQGASFDIIDSTGKIADTITTDAKGIAKSREDLLAGTYTLVEVVSPPGYVISPEIKTFTIVDGTTTAVKVEFINYKTGLTIIKTGPKGELLSGAKFEIKDNSGTIIETVTTGLGGVGKTSKAYKDGIYTATEVQAPVGYELENTPHTFRVKYGIENIAVLKITNSKQTPSITIIKYDENNAWLKGAEFDVFDSSGAIVDHLITTVAGEATTSSELTFGNYVLIETKAPNGYKLDETPITAILTPINMHVTVTMVNENIGAGPTGKLELLKTDEIGKPLAGAEFEIKNSNGDVVGNLITNATGNATINLPQGDYVVTETKAPLGYQLDSTPKSITITAVSGEVINLVVVDKLIPVIEKGSLEIKKTDDSGISLAGAKFEIKNSSGVVVGMVSTNSQGLGTILLDAGDYVVTEIEAPAGYEIDTTPKTITVKGFLGEIVKISVINIKVVKPNVDGVLELVKVDENGNPLAGAEFEIKELNGTSKGVIISDINGSAKISLPKGDYIAIETKAPNGYILDSTPKNFTIQGYLGEIVSITIINKAVIVDPVYKGKIEITNVDEIDTPLEGGVFEIRKPDGTVVGTLTIGPDGVITSTELEPGNYQVVQIVPPNGGYELNPTEFEVTIVGYPGEVVKVKVVNTKKPRPEEKGKISIRKINEEGKVLSGAEFEIKDSTEKVVDTIITDKDGKASTKDLDKGNYVITETKAPQGYILDSTSRNTTISGAENNIVEITVLNKKIPAPPAKNGELQLLKVDEEGNVLAGAEFEIRDSNNKVVKTIVSDANGLAQAKDLQEGSYTVVEAKAPNGYVLKDIKLNITIIGNTKIAYKVINTKIKPEQPKLPQTGGNQSSEAILILGIVAIVLGYGLGKRFEK